MAPAATTGAVRPAVLAPAVLGPAVLAPAVRPVLDHGGAVGRAGRRRGQAAARRATVWRRGGMSRRAAGGVGERVPCVGLPGPRPSARTGTVGPALPGARNRREQAAQVVSALRILGEVVLEVRGEEAREEGRHEGSGE